MPPSVPSEHAAVAWPYLFLICFFFFFFCSEEGVIVKQVWRRLVANACLADASRRQLASQYVPNERQLKWIKIKPEYLDGVGDDFDLLILGGFYGTGKRARHARCAARSRVG